MKSNREKIQEIVDKYPSIFKGMPRSGFYVGNGWLPMIERLCALIDHYVKNLSQEERGDIFVAQVKEKFGGLRFYMEGSTPYIDGMIAMAESMSYITCEECGAPGERRSGGWIRVLCDHHHEAEKKRKEEEARKWANTNQTLQEIEEEESDY